MRYGCALKQTDRKGVFSLSTYLIDFENVKSGGLAGIEYIKKEDSVHLFWSKRENKITIEMMELIRSSESEIVMHKAVTGERDALDHQLCSYLGFLAGAKGENDFVIVSNDKAYDHLIEFWKKIDSSIRIRRVPEISKISEMLKAFDMPVLADTMLEESAGKEEGAGTAEMEAAFSEVRSGRNFRRRERGGKYMKGGRNGRGNWKNTYAEEHYENHVSEATGEFSEESPVQMEETLFEAKPVQAAEKPAEELPIRMEETPVKVKQTPAAIVVTGIRTGIVVESGYTADGILDHRKTAEEEKTAEEAAESGKEKAEEAVQSSKEKAAAEKTEKSVGSETGKEKPARELSGKKASAKKGRMKKEALKEKLAKEEPKKEVSVKEESIKKEPEKEASVKEEPVKEEPEKKASVKEEPVKEEPEKEASVKEEPVKEKLEKEAPEKEESVKEKPKEEASVTEEPEKEKPIEETSAEEKTAKEETIKEIAVKEEATDEEQIKESSEKSSRSTEKAVGKDGHPAGRARRGRPPKKDRKDHVPEVKAPATEADVIAKCEIAANAEWTGEVVRLINNSRDKKELYASIVKLLGQEKGRTVYHEIKVLK